MSGHRWVIRDPEPGAEITKRRRQRELKRGLEAGQRRTLFKIVKVNGKVAEGERKRRDRAEVKAELKANLRKLSPERRAAFAEKLGPKTTRLEKTADGRKANYAGRPLLVSDRDGNEKRVGDQGVSDVEKSKRVSFADIADQPAFDGVSYRKSSRPAPEPLGPEPEATRLLTKRQREARDGTRRI